MPPRESPQPTPQELLGQMAGIRTLEQQFQTAKEQAKKTGDFTNAKQLKAKLEEQMNALRDKLNPFEADLHVREQYESQIAVLEKAGLLETFATGINAGKRGITDINSQEHPLPTYQEISRRMLEKREIIKTKKEQGFVKMLLVPFGLPLDTLIEKYRQTLQKHFDEGKLFHTKQNPDDPKEQPKPITALNDEGPLYVWDEYQGADMVDPKTNTSKLAYYPREFSAEPAKHQGKTKTEVIKLNNGWNILLIENMPNIPRAGQAKTIGKRTQIDTAGTSIKSYIEAGQTVPNPHEYLKAIQTEAKNSNSPYYQEQRMTPEDQLTYAIAHLEETNEVIDDWQENGSVSWQLGAYFPTSGDVPIAYWRRDRGRAYLNGNGPGNRNGNSGVRPAVGV